MAIKFETERLIIRDYEVEQDLEDAFEIYRDPEVNRYLGGPGTECPNLKSMRASLLRFAEKYSQIPPWGVWAVAQKSDQKVIGTCLCKELPDAEGEGTGDYEIGWHLGRKYWGVGYGTEFGRAVLDFSWQIQNHVDVIYAIAFAENLASLKIMQKIGMEYVGPTNKYYGKDVVQYRSFRPL